MASATKKEQTTLDAQTDALGLEDIKKQAALILEAAKQEAANILAEAMGKAQAEQAVTKEDAAAAKDKEYWNELVEVRLFKDNGKYKDDVYVAVNGENCLIQRGKPVMIKRKFAHALSNSDNQDQETADMLRGLQEDYEEKRKSYE